MKKTNAYPTADGTVRFGRTVKVKFPAKPYDEILESLKSYGFRFRFGAWEYEAADKDAAVAATKHALGLGAYLDLVGEMFLDTPDKIEAVFGDVRSVTDTPSGEKDFILFDTLDEARQWMDEEY